MLSQTSHNAHRRGRSPGVVGPCQIGSSSTAQCGLHAPLSVAMLHSRHSFCERRCWLLVIHCLQFLLSRIQHQHDSDPCSKVLQGGSSRYIITYLVVISCSRPSAGVQLQVEIPTSPRSEALRRWGQVRRSPTAAASTLWRRRESVWRCSRSRSPRVAGL